MNWRHFLRTCWRALLRKDNLDAHMDEELRSHIEMQTRENIEAGMNPEEARRAASRQFGWVESIKETCREQRDHPATRHLSVVAQDLRYGARQLLKNPGFTAVAALTLALGIGATTAIFSVVNAVLLRPLPYPDSGRLVEITDAGGPISIPNFTDWKEQQTVFEHLFLYKTVDLNVVIKQGDPQRVLGVRLSADAFPALRLAPAAGRFYSPQEDRPGGPQVAVLSHAFWQSRFGGDPAAVNQSLSINGLSYTIVGVAPAGFDLVERAEVMVPVEPGIVDGDRHNRKNQSSYEALARLKPGISLPQARAELTTIAQRLATLYPTTNKDRFIGLKPWIEARVGGVRRALWILFGAVLLVLLIACANVANLLMVRATSRRKEMAVRAALGAGHARILRQMLTESVLLALLGAALGLVLAQGGTALIGTLAQNHLPRAAGIGIDGPALLFSGAMALLAGVIFGFAPAWQSSRPNLSAMLNEASRGSSGARAPLLNSLLVAQVALSLMLLLGAGLLLRSFHRLNQVHAGFDHHSVLSFRLDLPDEKYRTPGMIDRFAQEMLARLRALPGVASASLATEIPTGNRSWVTDLLIEGRPEPKAHPLMEINLIESDYFRVMGIPILQGRAFNTADARAGKEPSGADQPDGTFMKAIVIDEEFARRYFPGQDPIGQQVRLPWGDRSRNPVMTVVGIAGRVKHEKLREENAKVLPMGYLAYRERPNKHIAAVVKTTLPPETLALAARQAVAALDPGLPIYDVITLAKLRADNVAPERLQLILLGGAALIALALAIIGIYGVVAFTVAQRQREFGVRLALGARRMEVVRLVLVQGMRLVLLGAALGLLGAFGLGRIIAGLLYQVGVTDWLTFTVAPMALIATAALACVVPARRAAKADPMELLRH